MYNQSHKYDLGTYNFFLHDLAQIFPRENALRFDKWQYCVHNSVFFSVYFSKIYHVTFLKVVPTLKKIVHKFTENNIMWDAVRKYCNLINM